MSNTQEKNGDIINGHIGLKKVFEDIVQRNCSAVITLDTLIHLIWSDLNLSLHGLSSSQLSALPYMLVNYIMKWPGWNKKPEFDSGTLDIESWYQRFRYYLTYKMSLLVTKTIVSVKDEVSTNSKSVIKVSTETQLSDRTSFANFSLDVAGPPQLLSTLVFWGDNESITVEEHSEKPWIKLDNVQLLNYPYVEVEFNSPELSFKRFVEPKMNRFLSGCVDFCSEKRNFIFGKHRINTKMPKFIFPASLLSDYIDLYKKTMYPQISKEQQEELEAVLNEFYKDLLEFSDDQRSVAENRQVSFNIGRNMYKRSKKIATEQDNGPSVIYNELFIPKVTSSFRYFTGMQEYDMEGKRLTSPNYTNSQAAMLRFKPVISYKCIYCKLQFGPDSREVMLRHLETSHTREQPLLCLLCKHSNEVMDLAKQRWKCKCQEENGKN